MKFSLSISRGALLCAAGFAHQFLIGTIIALIVSATAAPGYAYYTLMGYLTVVLQYHLLLRFIAALAIAWACDHHSTTGKAFASALTLNAVIMALFLVAALVF
jgi:hypothetical protein